METFKETLRKIWYILYPFLFYYAVMLIIMTIAQWAFGGDATHYVFCQLIATVFTIPSMLPFYRQGQALAGIAKQPLGISRERICHALFAAGIMACLGISLNNLISMTKLTEISMGYQQANTDFYGSTMVMENVCRFVYTDAGRTGIPGNYFRKIKRYAVETVCGWNFGIDFRGRACQYRAVYLRTDSRCGAGTSDGSCGKCLCIHDRTYDGKFYCSCADGNALAGFQRQGRCGRMDIFPDDTGSWDCADVEVFVR